MPDQVRHDEVMQTRRTMFSGSNRGGGLKYICKITEPGTAAAF
jgi:hypothetical protein